MDVHLLATTISDQEREQIDLWVAANHADDIESIAVHDRLVSVYGTRGQFTSTAGTAIRRNDLAGELSAALANMRNIATSPQRSSDSRN